MTLYLTIVVMMKTVIYTVFLSFMVAFAYLTISSEDTQEYDQKMSSCEIPSEPLRPSYNHSFFCCPGNVGYWISAGYKSPGEIIGFSARNVPLNHNGTVAFIVYKKTKDGWKIIHTDYDWHAEFILPSEQNVTYALSVYVFDKDCNLIDSLYSTVFVPIQKLNVELYLDKRIYKPGETAKLTIKNTGKAPILVGNPYEIYRFENGSWERVKLGVFFTLEGYEIMPGQSWTQKVGLMYFNESTWNSYPLPPGRYKIIKEVLGIGVEEKLTLEVEFEIRE